MSTLDRKKGEKAMDTEWYEKDFYKWAMENSKLMRLGRLSEIDAENIAEELESMGKSEKRAFINQLSLLLAHLLKWQFQPGLRSKSWRYSIKEQRTGLLDLLEDSPSLSHDIETKVKKSYSKALIIVAKQTGLDEDIFPRSCPYSFSQAVDDSFWPE